MLWRIDRSTTRTFKIFRSARVLGLHSSWTAAINYASMVHDPCCTGMRLNSNYQLNAAADAVIIVYELAKRAGNPPRRVRPRRTCSAGSHELRATVWRRSVPTTRGGETEGPEHMTVTSASGGNALSISLAQVEADFDLHVAARAPRRLPRRQPAEWSDDVRLGRALHRSVQGVHGVAGRDATVSVRCILVVRRLRIQSSRERSEVEHFRELACTAVCEPGGRRYILGCAAGSFIGQ